MTEQIDLNDVRITSNASTTANMGQSKRAAMVAALEKPFPAEAIKQRAGGGGSRLDYVSGHTVIRRLNTATQNQWDFFIIDRDSIPFGTSRKGDPQTLLIVHGRLTIEGLGTREALGVQIVTPSGGEDLYKGAETDSLKKAATKFGVALELYGDDYEKAVEVVVPPRKRLTDLLKAAGHTTKAKADAATQEQFPEVASVTDLSDEQVAAWILKLEKTQPVPF